MINGNSSQISSPRNTRQKTLILEYLKKNQGNHVTVDELYEQLKKSGTPVPKPTIYRNLSALEKNAYIKKYFVTDKAPACYQLALDCSLENNHFHFVCNSCGNIIHFNDYLLGNAMELINANNTFKIDNSKTVFYGLCEVCI